MTNPTPHGQVPEALQLADRLDLYATGDEHQRDTEAAAAELRRQHARIAELEAQLESIRAGGVNSPLVGQPQAVPDLTGDSVTAPADGEIDRLRAALVYVAFALHGKPQYMLAEGIALIDGDTVRVSHDGWTVEASINPARATPPAKAADSVLEDAARLDWLLPRISGAEFRRLGVHYSGNARRADVDAARKQGANHD